MNRKIDYVVPPEFDGEKVNNFLRGGIGISYRTVRSLKQIKGSMLLDGEPIRTIDPLKAGATLTLILPADKSTAEPQQAQFETVYEDDDILVINKPAGLAMHPTHNHQGDTLANAVAYYLAQKGKDAVFRAAGRLDKGTSGIVICALHKFASAKLAGSYEKEYIAVVEGEYTGSGTINAPIIRPDPMKTLRAVGEGGEHAVTHWTALENANGLSKLHITLETGRTHQIRVHFAWLGTPLAGDDMYGGSTEKISRHALHCTKVTLIHPVTNEKMVFEAPLPDDMKKLFRE
ncbi:MAG: RluA family pseudouridine synthase [Clostridia bacterium]|nr:RluA family pseudouridine synthase [Clostridia bacterium]